MLPEDSVEYRLFGGDPSDRNYAHFDLLVGSSVSIPKREKKNDVKDGEGCWNGFMGSDGI